MCFRRGSLKNGIFHNSNFTRSCYNFALLCNIFTRSSNNFEIFRNNFARSRNNFTNLVIISPDNVMIADV